MVTIVKFEDLGQVEPGVYRSWYALNNGDQITNDVEISASEIKEMSGTLTSPQLYRWKLDRQRLIDDGVPEEEIDRFVEKVVKHATD